MSVLEPHPGMAPSELAKLRDELRASIERSQALLRRTELLLIAAHLARGVDLSLTNMPHMMSAAPLVQRGDQGRENRSSLSDPSD